MSEDGKAPSPQPPPARGGGEEPGLFPLREEDGGRRQRMLCRIDEIPDGTSKGFPPPPGGFTGLFAVRQGDAVFVYVNSCPHIGTPLDWTPRPLPLRRRQPYRLRHARRRVPHHRRRMPARPLLRRSPGTGRDRDQGRHHIRARGCRPLGQAREGTRSCQTSTQQTDSYFRSSPRSPRRRISPPRAIRTCSSAPRATRMDSGPSSLAASPG